MTPITVNLLETYKNKLLQEYEWQVGTSPDWDLDCPDGEESIYFGVQIDGENKVSYIIAANIVYRDGVLDEQNYEVFIGNKRIEESESCYMEELEAVVNKYMALAGKKKKEYVK